MLSVLPRSLSSHSLVELAREAIVDAKSGEVERCSAEEADKFLQAQRTDNCSVLELHAPLIGPPRVRPGPGQLQDRPGRRGASRLQGSSGLARRTPAKLKVFFGQLPDRSHQLQ